MFQIASSDVANAASEAAGHASSHGHGLPVVPEHMKVAFLGSDVHLDTIVATWVAMAIAIVFVLTVRSSMKRSPDKKQTVAEAVIEFVEWILKGHMGEHANDVLKYIPFIGSIFLFVIFSNWLGVLPMRVLHLIGVPMEIMSPTNDLNTCAALAVIAVISYFYYGISKKGLSYFKHYFTPMWFFLPFNMLEDITRPLSLSFRLFGNIIGGEILLAILLYLVPWFIPLPIFGFEVFVGFIQAFVFATLTAAYISTAVADHHHDDHGEAH